MKKRNEIKGKIQEKINSQIELTRNIETSPKNTTLYFNILLKSKDIYKIKVNLIEEFYNSYKQINNLFYTGQLTVPGPGVPPSIISGQVVADYITKQLI